MIMMVADIVFHPSTPEAEGRAYAEKHYPVMTKWAEYLLANCLYPVNQLSTDDFIGPTELNSGLALKGILGLAAFAKLSGFVENTANEELYTAAVASYIPTWLNESLHIDGDHLKMEYNVTNGYQFKYNAFHDKLLGLNIVPQEVYEMEAKYYLDKLEPYGIPFVSTHDYTKSGMILMFKFYSIPLLIRPIVKLLPVKQKDFPMQELSVLCSYMQNVA
jgi:hypothetical protein